MYNNIAMCLGKSIGKTWECSLKRHPTDIFCLLRSTDSNSRVFTSKHSFPFGLFQASCQSSFTSNLVFFSQASFEAFDYFWLQVILWVVYHPPGAPAWYQRRCPPVQYFFPFCWSVFLEFSNCISVIQILLDTNTAVLHATLLFFFWQAINSCLANVSRQILIF